MSGRALRSACPEGTTVMTHSAISGSAICTNRRDRVCIVVQILSNPVARGVRDHAAGNRVGEQSCPGGTETRIQCEPHSFVSSIIDPSSDVRPKPKRTRGEPPRTDRMNVLVAVERQRRDVAAERRPQTRPDRGTARRSTDRTPTPSRPASRTYSPTAGSPSVRRNCRRPARSGCALRASSGT